LADRFPVSVVMERRAAQLGPWEHRQWTAVGVVAGQAVSAGSDRRRARIDDDGAEKILWTGLRLVLHRDAAESYWYNLVGQRPSLFIVCRFGEDEDLVPWAVTADYDEAGAYMETDEVVYAVPMPPEIHRWLEEYVMNHYRPVPPMKRQRTQWSRDSRRRPTR
jgi:hypothetical protein